MSIPGGFEREKYPASNTRHASQVFTNSHRRAVRCPGFVGARIQGKYAAGSSHHAGMGDCILLDFSKSFFAVADASDRNTSASRKFIVMFARMLEEKALLNTHKIYSQNEVSALQRQLATESEKLLASIPFRESSTFTGVVLLQTTDGITAIVMHTGDSLLFKFDLATSISSQFTNTNFWLVGKTQRFFQIDNLPIGGTTRLLLATDGFYDISVPPETNREEFLLHSFEAYSPDELPDLLLREPDVRPDTGDDMTIITINPSAMIRFPERIIIGGTTGKEERTYQKERNQGLFADQYVPSLRSDKISNHEIFFLS